MSCKWHLSHELMVNMNYLHQNVLFVANFMVLTFFEFHDIYNAISCEPGPEVMKLFSCSAQLTPKFIQLINVKMPFNIYEQDKLQTLAN